MLKGRGPNRPPLDKFYQNPFNQPDPVANPPPTKEELLVRIDTPYATGVKATR